MYDEQVMLLAESAGIAPEDAVILLKSIKKKKAEKVKKFEEDFIPGFIKYLREKENVKEELAEKTAQDVWTVILNSSSYLFNASHAYAMCLDSLYGATLKTIAPYEFYLTMLKLYTEKGNKEKIALIINEMKRYKNISLTAGSFGQDNRDWYCDKENQFISQNLSSIKFISKNCAEDLYNASKHSFDSFVDLLRYLQMETCVDTRQIEILISLGYFAPFYKTAKCMAIAREFFEGESKLTKNYVERTVEKRLSQLRAFEKNCVDTDLDIAQKVNAEFENISMCISTTTDPIYKNCYYVKEVDSSHGVKVYLYNLTSGNNSLVRIAKDKFEKFPIESKTILHIQRCRKSPRKTFKNGRPENVPGEFDWWLQDYTWRKITILKIKERSEN